MKTILLLSLLVFSISTARTQTYSFPNYPTIPPAQSPAATQTARIVAEAHKKARQNADKLILLAGQLKTEIDKTPAGTLSVEAIKKADEIEKLAHAITQELKQ
jgi:hypothetical protein